MKTGDKSSLVSVLHELGSTCCEPTILEDILTQILSSSKNSEAQVSQAIFMIAESSVAEPAWNPEVFTQVLLRAVTISFICIILIILIFFSFQKSKNLKLFLNWTFQNFS